MVEPRQAEVRQLILDMLKEMPFISTQLVATRASCHWHTAERVLLEMCIDGSLKRLDYMTTTAHILFIKNELYALWQTMNEPGVNLNDVLPE